MQKGLRLLEERHGYMSIATRREDQHVGCVQELAPESVGRADVGEAKEARVC